MYELAIITAEFISAMIFQVTLPIGVLVWKWNRIRAKRTVDYAKQKRATMASQMVSRYV
jgi:hypothetical protein